MTKIEIALLETAENFRSDIENMCLGYDEDEYNQGRFKGLLEARLESFHELINLLYTEGVMIGPMNRCGYYVGN